MSGMYEYIEILAFSQHWNLTQEITAFLLFAMEDRATSETYCRKIPGYKNANFKGRISVLGTTLCFQQGC